MDTAIHLGQLKWSLLMLSLVIEYNVDYNDKDPKFKIGAHVRISKYKNIFAKGHTANWP